MGNVRLMARRARKDVPGRALEAMREYDPYQPRMFGTTEECLGAQRQQTTAALAMLGDIHVAERDHARAAATKALAAHDAGRAVDLMPKRARAKIAGKRAAQIIYDLDDGAVARLKAEAAPPAFLVPPKKSRRKK
jgi:hypothetical protein